MRSGQRVSRPLSTCGGSPAFPGLAFLGFADLGLLGSVDAMKTDAFASDLDGVAVDDTGCASDVSEGRKCHHQHDDDTQPSPHTGFNAQPLLARHCRSSLSCSSSALYAPSPNPIRLADGVNHQAAPVARVQRPR